VQAIWLLILIFSLTILLGVLLGALQEFSNYPIIRQPLVMGLVNLIAFGLPLIYALKIAKTSFKEVFSFKPVRFSLYLPLSLTIIGFGILISELDNLFRTILPMPSGFADFYSNLALGQTSLWGSVVVIVVIAPLTEEFLFRGFILRGFLSQYSLRKAVLASALLFGVFHLNPWQFLGASIAGVLLAWIFVRTRSLLPCLYGHALNNAIPIILMSLFNMEIPGVTSGLIDVEFQPFWLDLCGLFSACLGLWLLKKMFDRNDSMSPEYLPVTNEGINRSESEPDHKARLQQ